MSSMEVLFPACLRGEVERLLAAVVTQAVMAGVHATGSTYYQGNAEWLCVYGVGLPAMREAVDKHRAKGGSVLQFDLGYWDRYSLWRKWRISINTDHPTTRDVELTKPNAARVGTVKHRFNKRAATRDVSTVLVVGIGVKSRAALGYEGAAWERAAVARVREHYPNAKVFYRPKKNAPDDDVEADRVMKPDSDIDSTLVAVDLAVCRHSNVAVDCAFAGTSCVVEGGVGAALYASTFDSPPPSVEARWDFLTRVAQWQWARAEMYDCLRFVMSHSRKK